MTTNDPFFAIGEPTPDEVLRCAEAICARSQAPADCQTRRVVPRGVRWRNEYFTHPLLGRHVGRRVEVTPSESGRVDVYVGNEWVCTAVRATDLSDADRRAVTLARWTHLGLADSAMAADVHRRASLERDDRCGGQWLGDALRTRFPHLFDGGAS